MSLNVSGDGFTLDEQAGMILNANERVHTNAELNCTTYVLNPLLVRGKERKK